MLFYIIHICSRDLNFTNIKAENSHATNITYSSGYYYYHYTNILPQFSECWLFVLHA